jgi:hypothetical protein
MHRRPYHSVSDRSLEKIKRTIPWSWGEEISISTPSTFLGTYCKLLGMKLGQHIHLLRLRQPGKEVPAWMQKGILLMKDRASTYGKIHLSETSEEAEIVV